MLEIITLYLVIPYPYMLESLANFALTQQMPFYIAKEMS